MSLAYEIGLMANENVAKAVDAFFSSDEAKKTWGKYDRVELDNGSVMYRTWCNNHPSRSTAGMMFLDTIRRFEGALSSKDAFKCILLSENGDCDEYSNAPGRASFDTIGHTSMITYPEVNKVPQDKEKKNELMVAFGSTGYVYFHTNKAICKDAVDEFLCELSRVGVNTDNLCIKTCVLRDNEENDIDEWK